MIHPTARRDRGDSTSISHFAGAVELGQPMLPQGWVVDVDPVGVE